MSIAFFMALFNAFKILGYIGQNKIFSAKSALAFKNIKYCAFLLGALIIGTGLYIKQFHHKDDDPAGFLALCMVATLITLIVATATIIFEKILHNAIDIKSENDLTV